VVSHYAPRTPMHLVRPDDIDDAARAVLARGTRVAVLASSPALQADAVTWIVAAADPETYGRQLYSHLRALDEAGASAILVAQPPATPEWHAVHDRLTRAAAR